MSEPHPTYEAWFQKARDEGRQLTKTEFHLARTFGARQGDMAVFEADELGYRCPLGHERVTWSEFNEHIWCYTCGLDILTHKCPIKKPEFMTNIQFQEFIARLPFKAIIWTYNDATASKKASPGATSPAENARTPRKH